FISRPPRPRPQPPLFPYTTLFRSPDAIARPQFYVHLGALLLLLAAFFWPQFFFYPALVVLGLSILWLYKNITIALRKYQSALNLIQTTLAQEQQNKP